jgi:hypothetical protein
VMQQGDNQLARLTVLCNLGQIYTEIGAPEKALTVLECAWSDWQRGPIVGLGLEIQAALANAHLRLKDLPSAERWLVADVSAEDDCCGLGEFHIARAGLATAHGDVPLMERECELARAVYARLGARAHLAHLYVVWVEYRERMQSPDIASLRAEAARRQVELHRPAGLVSFGSGASKLATILDGYAVRSAPEQRR